MKARVKATGIVLDVYPSHIIRDNVKEIIWYKTPQGACFTKDELEFIDTENNFDYWTRLEHTYAGMAMQGILNNNLLSSVLFKTGTTHMDYINEVIKVAEEYAHALVEKMKEVK